ncbi:hypothetical protein GCM10010345_84660 [Streptomyces canarius]|uniref:Uncharacterized protein n=1 Tax=Streptomyces canarius TaxID=285453 RepID=A0ABQ3D9A2_9ACTN|nr:hypothetical protein GCM10010345_84660 [Streptomyces canarius]
MHGVRGVRGVRGLRSHPNSVAFTHPITSPVHSSPWLPSVFAVRGDTAPIPAVALFGGAVFGSGTIVNVTIHIRR